MVSVMQAPPLGSLRLLTRVLLFMGCVRLIQLKSNKHEKGKQKKVNTPTPRKAWTWFGNRLLKFQPKFQPVKKKWGVYIYREVFFIDI